LDWASIRVSRASHHPTADDLTILAGNYGVLLLIDIESGIWSFISFSAQLRLSISPVKRLFLTYPLKQGVTNIDRPLTSHCVYHLLERDLQSCQSLALLSLCVTCSPPTNGMDSYAMTEYHIFVLQL